MPENAIDYTNTHFVHKELTKIHNKPTYESLKKLKDELKANCASVRSNLDEGQHRHLGLAITPAEQALFYPIPYVRPVDPGPLVLPHGSGVTNLQREIGRDAHKEAQRVWIKATEVERSGLKQLVKALPPLYVKGLLNRVSMSITQPLFTVLTTLFTMYHDVTAEELEVALTALKASF